MAPSRLMKLGAWTCLVFTAMTLLGSAAPLAAEGLHVGVRKVEVDEFPRVRVIFEVSGPEKMPFRRLMADNVRILEEEVAVRDLELMPYRAGVSIGLVVDDSGSIDPDLGYLKEAAGFFVDQLAPYDELAVVSFGRLVNPLQQITNDKRLMKDAVAGLKAYGASALYDGIAVAMHESSRGIGRQVIVVVSDGNEEDFSRGPKRLSMDTLPHLIRAARHHAINIYTVGVGPRVNDEVLGTLAGETGGRYLRAPRASSLRALFAEIAESFQSSYQAVYQSPNMKEDRLVRGGVVKVRFLDRSGWGTYRYTMRPQTAVSKLSVQRTEVWKDKFARMRVYTRGARETFVDMEFTLRDRQGKVVRQGRTTRDGYGAPLGGGMPELLELAPGTYGLDLKEPGTDLVFEHPRIVLARGQSTDLTFNYSKLVFRRNGKFWYDSEHALGDTSDLLDLSIQDLGSGKILRKGAMSVFKRRREAFVWLEEGAYRVRLDNLLVENQTRNRRKAALPSVEPGVEPAVLRNALSAELAARGGDVLFFDVAYDDFLLEQDPRLIPDEIPEPPREGEPPPMNEMLAQESRKAYMTHVDELRETLGDAPRETLAPEKVSRADIRKLSGKRKGAASRGGPVRKTAASPAAKPKAVELPEGATEPPSVPSPAGPSGTQVGSAKDTDDGETEKLMDEAMKPALADAGSGAEQADKKAVARGQLQREVKPDKIAGAVPVPDCSVPKPDSELDRHLEKLKKLSDARPGGSASSRNETDGSVFVSPSKPPQLSSSPVPTEVVSPMPPPRAAVEAPAEEIQGDEVIAKLRRMRDRARQQRAPASEDALAKLQKLAGR